MFGSHKIILTLKIWCDTFRLSVHKVPFQVRGLRGSSFVIVYLRCIACSACDQRALPFPNHLQAHPSKG